jgi:CRP-like cAMP-binding protein
MSFYDRIEPYVENHEIFTTAICASPIFKNLSQENFQKIFEISMFKKIKKNEILFKENDKCIFLHILISGKIKLFMSKDKRELVLKIFDGPCSFSEAPVFDEIDYHNASAQALLDSDLLLIEKDTFKQIAANTPILASNIFSVLSTRIRTIDKQLESLNLKSVEARLANYILELIPKREGNIMVLRLPVPKTMLAAKLGTVIETLSRAFRNLKKQNLIKMQDDALEILDYEKLEEIAQS